MSSHNLGRAKTITRLRTRQQFVFVRSGRSAARHNLVVQTCRRNDGEIHVGAGFTATKKIGKATVRNRAKRRLRAAANLMLDKHGQPGSDYVFIARKTTATSNWQHLLDDMKSALTSLTRRLPAKKRADHHPDPFSDPNT